MYRRLIGSSPLNFAMSSKSIAQGQCYKIALEISPNEKVLRHSTRIFVIAVIAPISFSSPTLRKPVVNSGKRLVVRRVEGAGGRIRRDDQNRTARPGQVCTNSSRESMPGRPVRVEITIVRGIRINRQLLHQSRSRAFLKSRWR